MSALADARFRRLLIGNSISSLGDSMLFLTLGVWTKNLTGSNAAAGAIFLAQGAPYLIAPFAGQLVDRLNRRRVLIAANVLTGAFVLALLAVHSRDQLWVLYLVSVGYGLGSTIITPAGVGLLKDLLSDQDLAGANAANTTIRQGLRIVSPLIGVALYTAFGGGSVAIVDAVSFLAAIGALLSVQIAETAPALRGKESIGTELLAGVAHLLRTPMLLQLIAIATTAYLVIGFYESATFAVIGAIGRPASFFGVLMSVQAAGSIAGGLGTGRAVRRFGETRALGLAMIIWSLASVVYVIPHVAASCAALIAFGIAIPLFSVAVDTATQRYTPPRLQGRVAAASNMAMGLAQTVSIAIGAALIDIVGYRPLLLTVATVTALAAVPALVRPAPPPAQIPAVEMVDGSGLSQPISHTPPPDVVVSGLLGKEPAVNLSPFLLFDGNCTEAMQFYQSCLGGDLAVTRVRDTPMKEQSPPEVHDKVAYAQLTNGLVRIAGTDWQHPTRVRREGNAVALYLNEGSPGQLKAAFDKLAAGSDPDVLDELRALPIGSYGHLADRYGVHWFFRGDAATSSTG